MFKQRLILPLICSFIMAGLLFSYAGIASAGDSEQDQGTTTMAENAENLPSRAVSLQDILKDLVNDSVISQSQADQLKNLCNDQQRDRQRLNQAANNGFRNGLKKMRGGNALYGGRFLQGPYLLSKAVAEQIITEEQARAITEIILAQHKERVAEQLNGLVEKGTITQEERDKVVAYLESSLEARQAEKKMTQDERKAYMQQQRQQKPDIEVLKNMTPEERHDWMQQNRPSPLKALVDDGTLTEEQAKAIIEVLR